MDSRANALKAARTALERHAEDVVVMDMRGLSTVTDFFVICTAASTRQLAALTEHIDAALHQRGCTLRHTEGIASSSWIAGPSRGPQWVLMDFGELVVHLFDQETRAFYRLERLWADAPRLAVEAPAMGPRSSRPTTP